MGLTEPVRLLAISGSLRRASSNTALVEALTLIAPAGVEITVYRDLVEIPPFNPDLDADIVSPVRGFRTALESCDGLVVSSPEYAHGVSGVLKNALDWIVGTGELIDKPIALLNTSTRATHALASLKEILTTMSARVIEEASIVISLDGRGWDAAAIANHEPFATRLVEALDSLARASSRRDRT